MGCQNSVVILPTQQSKATFKKIPNKRQLFANISNHSNLQYTQNIQPLSRQIIGKDLLLIDKILEKHFLFYKLTKQQRLKLIESMEKFTVQANTIIFQEGDQPTYALIIVQGVVEINIKGSVSKKTLHAGDFLGDLALLNVVTRSASALSKTKCQFWGLSKSTFHKKMSELNNRNKDFAYKYIDESPLFNKFTPSQKQNIATATYQAKFEKDMIIFREGDTANTIYIIITGEVEITIAKKPSICLKKGEIFGQGALKKNQKRIGTAKAINETHLLVLSRQKLSTLIQQSDLYNITFHCILKWALKRSKIFINQPKSNIEKVIETGKYIYFQDNQIIKRIGEPLSEIIVSLQGEIRASENQSLKYQVGTLINEELLNSKYDKNLYKKQAGAVFQISYSDIEQILYKRRTNQTIKTKQQIQSTQLPIQIQLSDLQIIQRYDSTELADIYCVRSVKNNINYVIKCYLKNKVVSTKQQLMLQRQRKLHFNLHHPFVIPLIKTFKDNHFVFLLYQYYPNFTIFDIIHQLDNFSDDFIKFSAANLILRLQYLHSEGILLRDLRAQKCLINSQGYVFFADFSIAKQLKAENMYRTSTILGTPHYMAPEINDGQGYSFPVDIWSFGVLLFYLIHGYLPFGDNLDDPYEIFSTIENNQLSFPTSYTDEFGKQLLQRLLLKNPEDRKVIDFAILKKMKYFSQYTQQNWKQIKEGTVMCPVDINEIMKKTLTLTEFKAYKIKNISLLAHLSKIRCISDPPLKSRRNTLWDKQF